MKEVVDYLVEWTIMFLKNKDIIAKNLENIERKNSKLTVNYIGRVQFFIIDPFLENFDFAMEKAKEKNVTLVVLNNKGNFEKLIDKWDKLKNIESLCMYFVNPLSELEKKWIVYPSTHSRICDEDSLEKGLKSMFESVDRVTEQTVEMMKKKG